jgi:hypothetical protein
MNRPRVLRLASVVLALSLPAIADPGMWLFDHPPAPQIKARYNFTLTPAWLDHTRLSSARFNNGGSGSFVSATGLTFTNHHVAQTCLYGLSSKEHDLYKTGFQAATLADEAKCPDLELNVLVSTEDVTPQVNAGTTPGMPAAEASIRQRANAANLEAQCAQTTGLRCDVVTFYAGGMHQLYRYKKYTDVRLVFAPEFAAAFFGGDPDNFEYPRYDLDIAFFRVYENGEPARLDNYFKWSAAGAKDGDLVFVSGNPGSTGRVLTVAQLQFLRDVSYPSSLDFLARRIRLLQDYSAQGTENARQAQELLFSNQNSYKAISGYQSGLLDPALMREKTAEEDQLKAAGRKLPQNPVAAGDPWNAIARAMDEQKAIFLPLTLLERRSAGELAEYARTLVRAAAERAKPNPERLREFRESALPSLEQHLFASNPEYKPLNAVLLADWLTELQQKLPQNPPVRQGSPARASVAPAGVEVLAGKDPAALARQMIDGTRLDDPAVRKQLYAGGAAALAASTDPLILFMKAIDPEARSYRKQYEDKVEAVERQDGAELTRIRFAIQGSSTPPDATFTLRLSYGAVRDYVEDGRGTVAPKGAHVSAFTALGGAFEHATAHGDKSPYQLPESWIKARAKLNLAAPLNFVSTADIIGGNSGSPVVNTAGEVVGIIFDGNIQSLPWRFAYEDAMGRAVSVDVRGILEALRNVYGAARLVDELTGKEALAPPGK